MWDNNGFYRPAHVLIDGHVSRIIDIDIKSIMWTHDRDHGVG